MIPGVLNEPGTISMNGVGSNDISVHLNESGTINTIQYIKPPTQWYPVHSIPGSMI